jgi:hypothetical protein
VVKNAFGILKQTFIELLKKMELHITIVTNVFIACCLLHNLIVSKKKKDVKELM